MTVTPEQIATAAKALATEVDPLWPHTITGEQITKVCGALRDMVRIWEKAEARVKRLEEALKAIASPDWSPSGHEMWAINIARAALEAKS